MAIKKHHPGKMQKRRRPARVQIQDQAGHSFRRTAIRQTRPENETDKQQAVSALGLAALTGRKNSLASALSLSGKHPGADEFEVIAGRIKGMPANYREKVADFQRNHSAGQMNALQDRILGPATGARVRNESRNGAHIMRAKGKSSSPPKLSKKTISAPTTSKHGGFNWVVQWKLDKASPKGGWIVQKVRANFDVKDDKNASIDVKANTGGAIDPGWWTMWEAWPVKPGKNVTTYASDDSDPEDDTYGLPGHGNNTKGKQEILGDAEFFEGVDLPSSFKVTNKAPAWILPTTKSDPGMANGSGSIAHNITATWDSVKGDGKTKATTS